MTLLTFQLKGRLNALAFLNIPEIRSTFAILSNKILLNLVAPSNMCSKDFTLDVLQSTGWLKLDAFLNVLDIDSTF